MDATGVGESVAELVEKEMPVADIYKVYITGGIDTRVDYAVREVRLPKSQMVSTLVVSFDSKRIFLSKRGREINEMM